MSRFDFDMMGRFVERANVDGMMFPVRCVCGQVYDTAKVTVTARYTDCSVWKAPCCGRQADDRGPGWSAVQHYTKLDQNGCEVPW